MIRSTCECDATSTRPVVSRSAPSGGGFTLKRCTSQWNDDQGWAACKHQLVHLLGQDGRQPVPFSEQLVETARGADHGENAEQLADISLHGRRHCTQLLQK